VIPDPQLWSAGAESRPSTDKIGDLAAEAGLRRVHLLAWRDAADVEAGGSELHAAAVARLWAAAGIEVTMRTSYAQGSPPETVRDGYRVIRRAGRYLVFPRAIMAELTGRHGRRDGLVEIWNGMPFFTPLWARGPRVTFLHHLHTEMWPLVMPPRLARAGQVVERDLAPWLYRRSCVITLSDSSRAKLLAETRLRPGSVHVVPPGVSDAFTPGGSRSARPLLVAVGRLMPSKRFDALIELVDQARRRVPVRLTIVGEGYERDRLQHKISELGADGWCELAGFVPEGQLIGLYRSAWAVVSTSISEGWGMTMTEAAACGTPAIATRGVGHIDSVDHGRTGLLADTDADMVAGIVRIVKDPALRTALGDGARAEATRFSWERTAHDTLAVLAFEANRLRGH
jgi:glycosyltransferase involved in cell wall biosynthesis